MIRISICGGFCFASVSSLASLSVSASIVFSEFSSRSLSTFGSLSRGTLDNMGSGSGVSIHWMWMVPIDSLLVLQLQLAFPLRLLGHSLVDDFRPLGKG